jgi:hypothetical protein
MLQQILKKTLLFWLRNGNIKLQKPCPSLRNNIYLKIFQRRFCWAANEGEKRNQLSNPSAIRKADLLFISVRRRAFKEETMELIRSHIAKGKPIIGIRTGIPRLPTTKGNSAKWSSGVARNGIGEIMGGNYNGHYGKELICTIQYATNSRHHPLLEKVKTTLQHTCQSVPKFSPPQCFDSFAARVSERFPLLNLLPGSIKRQRKGKFFTPHSVMKKTLKKPPSIN